MTEGRTMTLEAVPKPKLRGAPKKPFIRDPNATRSHRLVRSSPHNETPAPWSRYRGKTT